jgi:hypothetical protein
MPRHNPRHRFIRKNRWLRTVSPLKIHCSSYDPTWDTACMRVDKLSSSSRSTSQSRSLASPGTSLSSISSIGKYSTDCESCEVPVVATPGLEYHLPQFNPCGCSVCSDLITSTFSIGKRSAGWSEIWKWDIDGRNFLQDLAIWMIEGQSGYINSATKEWITTSIPSYILQ